MLEDPEIIRLNVQRLENLLKQELGAEKRGRIATLLKEARSQLADALDEERKVS
jgi:hypothetical protein